MLLGVLNDKRLHFSGWTSFLDFPQHALFIFPEVVFNILSSGMQKSLEFALWGLQSKKQDHPFFHITSPSVDLVFEQAIRTIVLAYY